MNVIQKNSPRIQSGIADRVIVDGKFLAAGGRRFSIRGVTYGTFRPDLAGEEYSQAVVARDFAAMEAAGFNAVRLYTAPPRWLLDTALQHGLRVMIGLAWEQHVAFLDSYSQTSSILERVKSAVGICAGHPAVLCYSLGNEIPSSIVRWYGAKRIETWIEKLCETVRAVDSQALVTYVNYPSTEYLRLPFLDFSCFNVYLEEEANLKRYLARLQNLSGDHPLVLAEVGLDSQRNGVETQATTLEWQIQASLAGGAAGLFVFSWTDEWHRGGFDIEDWDFGLTTRSRDPKPALSTVSMAFERGPFPPETLWPRITVVVCTYNGAQTLADCLDGLSQLDYPDYEVIVVVDGSTDSSSLIASEFDVHVISTPNQGLSAARNTGMHAATGEIVAYTDDDARPTQDWLKFLAWGLMTTEHAGIGGPNIAPAGDGPIAACVANAPGGPIHVLLTDEIAEHIPGCNMAFRRERLIEVGGFDPRFRAAGDDVDLCWRIQNRGWTIGFNPAATVWHHRRNSVRAYWKQQVGYGKAEALLEAKWPSRYNAIGHVAWKGQLYGNGWTKTLGSRMGAVYQGTWGQAAFQSLYHRQTPRLAALPLMPEWWLAVLGLAVLSLLGFVWQPLFLAAPLLGLAIAAPVLQAWSSTADARFPEASSRFDRLKLRLLTAGLHLAQPVARLRGRMTHGLTPWRPRGRQGWALPIPRTFSVWSEEWRSPEHWLGEIEERINAAGAVVYRGGDFDRWDLEVRGGLFGSARLLHAIEEHGGGKQLVQYRVWPRWAMVSLLLSSGLGLSAIVAMVNGEVLVGGTLLVLGVLTSFPAVRDTAGATNILGMAASAGNDRR